MFGLNESTKYYVCQRYVRMNMGINGLYKIVRSEMELPPLGGAVFIFSDRSSKKGYLWAVGAPKLGLVFFVFVYEDDSRSEEIILDVFSDFKGTVQSDAYVVYKKMESDASPDITRIACLQHSKRKFIDCGDDKDAREVVGLFCKLYHGDHKHTALNEYNAICDIFKRGTRIWTTTI